MPPDPDGGPIIYDEGGPPLEAGPIFDEGAPDVDASPIPEPCANGAVTFELEVAAGSASTYCAVLQDPTSGTSWLSLDEPDGGFAIDSAPRIPNCASCETNPDQGNFETQGLVATGPIVRVWAGTMAWFSTCGPSGTACVTPVCSAAGTYIAHMCADSECPGQPNTVVAEHCVDVPFDYPTTETVVGILP